MILSLFLCVSVGHLYVFFGEMSIHGFCKFLIGSFGAWFCFVLFWVLVLGCISPLYVLDTNSLPDISFSNIFTISVGCLVLCFLCYTGLFKMFIYLYLEKERESELGRGRGRGRERIPTRLCTVSMKHNTGLNLMNCEIMT